MNGLLGDLREQDLQRQTVLAELEERRKLIETQNITNESKKLSNTLAELQAKRELQAIENATAGIISEATRSSIEGAQELINATNLVAANEERRKELLEQGINPALADALIEVENQFAEKRKMLNIDIELLENALLRVDAESDVAKKIKEKLDYLKKIKGELDDTEDKAKENAKDQNPGKLKEYMNQLQEEFKDTEAIAVQMAQVIESELGRALSSAITGVLDGTTTVQEAFASMFENIGKAFISMASEMIAKLLVLKALQMITGTLGGGGGGASSVSSSAYGDMSVAGPSFFGGGMIPGYSNGGFLPANGPAIVGENGPEFVYSQGGRTQVFSNEDSKAAMAMYSPGNETGPESNVTMNFETTQFMDREWVDREQLERAMAQTRMEATLAGARKGEAMTLSRLQNSRSSRSKLGL